MTNDNRKVGTQFQTDFCEKLSDAGFWVHNMVQGRRGQPADVIAALNGRAFLIDCKDCRSGSFDTRRIEPNQASSMDLWGECGNGDAYFAVKFGDAVYMVTAWTIALVTNVKHSRLKEQWFERNARPLDEWIKEVTGWQEV